MEWQTQHFPDAIYQLMHGKSHVDWISKPLEDLPIQKRYLPQSVAR